MFFQNIKKFILENKKTMLFLSFLVMALFPEFAFAEENEELSFLGILNWGVAIIAWFLWLLTQFVAIFMSPEWTNWEFIGFDANLKKLWIMMSNLVYMIFAFLLVWIAFMNILWKTGDWELKSALPRFIGWVLIVPFSWFFVNAMISLSSIMMTSVITLPYDSFPKDFEAAWKVEICKDFEVNFWLTDLKEVSNCKAYTTVDDFFIDWDSLSSIIAIYTYWIMSIEDNWKLKTADLSTVKWIVDLWIKWIIDLLLIIVFFILMVALMLALFVRWIYIWLFLVFSPLFGLMFFFWDKWWDSVLKKFSIKEFVALALVPVYVWAALSFGLLFIFVAWQWLLKSEALHVSDDKLSDVIEFWGFSLTINWSILGQNNEEKDSLSKLLTWLQWSISYLIIQIFWIAVLWMAVMAALKTSTITEQVTQPIQDFWNSVWQLAMKAPTYAPILPGGMSAAWLWAAWQTFKSNIDSHFQRKWSDKWSMFAEKFTWWTSDTAKAINNLATSWVKNYATATSDQIKKDVVPAIESLKAAWNETDFNRLVKGMIDKGIFKKDTKLVHWERLRTDFGEKVFKWFTPNVISRWEEAGVNNAAWVKEILKSVVAKKGDDDDDKSWTTSKTNDSSWRKFEDIKIEAKKIEEIDNNTKIEFINGKDKKDWDIRIISKDDLNIEEHSFNLNGTNLKNSSYTEFKGNDVDEAKKLLKNVWETNFKKVLEEMWYSKVDELFNNINK